MSNKLRRFTLPVLKMAFFTVPTLPLTFFSSLLPAQEGMLNIHPEPGHQVREVIPNSAADRGNLMTGDFILALNGKVFPDIKDFVAHVGSLPGSTVELSLIRNGYPLDITLTLGVFDGKDGKTEGRLGVLLGSGLLVESVPEGSKFEEAGLLPGDVITGLDGEYENDPVALQNSLLSSAEETTFARFYRNGKLAYLPVFLGTGTEAASEKTVELSGTIEAVSDQWVQIGLNESSSASPRTGDRVIFSTEIVGIHVDAGSGKIERIEATQAWAGSIAGNPDIGNEAVIYATGSKSEANKLDPKNLIPKQIDGLMSMYFPRDYFPKVLQKQNEWMVYPGGLYSQEPSSSDQLEAGPDYFTLSLKKLSPSSTAQSEYKRALNSSERFLKKLEMPSGNAIGIEARIAWKDREWTGKTELIAYRVDNSKERIYRIFADDGDATYRLTINYGGTGDAEQQDRMVVVMSSSFESLLP